MIAKRLIQECNNVTRVRIEPRSCDHGRKNDAFALSAVLPIFHQTEIRVFVAELSDRINLFSAYCGGLWLAALRSMVEAAQVLDHEEDKQKYLDILHRAGKAYDKCLWNGKSMVYCFRA